MPVFTIASRVRIDTEHAITGRNRERAVLIVIVLPLRSAKEMYMGMEFVPKDHATI